MSKFIDADKLKDAVEDWFGGDCEFVVKDVKYIVGEMPAADVEPVRRWIPVEESMPPEKPQQISEKNVLTGVITYQDYIGSDLVLVAVEDDSGNLFVSDDNTANGEWCCYGNMDIVAWMPLPEPPKMDGGSEE
ncbi:MAG: DUF551 domain-containing protein [Lachnospiraceae bacterium]|nr:DUF551 domain-containing protein [Lachnospiraceae bacterium]